MQKTRSLAVLIVLAASAAAAAGARGHPARSGNATRSPLDGSTQLLVVVTDKWDSVSGTLRRFARPATGAAWQQLGASVAVVVGRNGLAWDPALRVERGDGPVKKEGDGKSPAGVFPLGEVFGQSPRPPTRLAMPYLSLGDSVECVDDVRSTQYNSLVTTQQVGRADWTSSEKMWAEPLYKWGVVVGYNNARVGAGRSNAPAPRPGAGSCIFLHIWRAPTSGTAGCTAMAEPNLLDIVGWLSAPSNAVLVQLPRAEYERLNPVWKLP